VSACCPSRRGCFASRILFVAVTLILTFSTFSRAQSSGSAIVFYADKQVSDDLWTPLFSAIQKDLASEDFGVANQLLNHSPRLIRSSEIVPGEEFTNVIQVKLLGRCDVAQQAYRPLKPGPLGWVLRVQGEIQPYIYIDCTRMAQVLNSTTLGMSNDARTHAMSQAISHVLMHEWIHIASQNAGHTTHGISEAQLTSSRLVAEPEPSHSLESDPGRLPMSIDRRSDAEE
jgi:hypothetical protein